MTSLFMGDPECPECHALRNLIVKGHIAYLARYSGRRPQKWDSLHSAILEKTLKPYRDRWDIIEKNLK